MTTALFAVMVRRIVLWWNRIVSLTIRKKSMMTMIHNIFFHLDVMTATVSRLTGGMDP
jgi:hypothetical protein